jgi:hypothetical protein
MRGRLLTGAERKLAETAQIVDVTPGDLTEALPIMYPIRKNKPSFSALRVVAAMSLCLAFGLARAQDNGPPDADPPDRAARLSYLQGDVSLQPAGEDEWADAIVNRPLTTGDKLWTDQGARAEIQVGAAAVRLGSDTGFSFLNVDDDTIQMRITSGVINVNVRALDGNDQIEIDTPNLALSVLRPGNYRVEVNDAGDTTVVKVSEGEAEASGGSQNVIVHAQQTATFRGNEQLAAQFASLGAPDDFDSWSLERERRDDRAATSQSAQYVSPDVTGYEDLDDNGTWSSEAEYGYVWTPRAVAVDWSPYRDGRWAWVAPWGWTWIDDAPWGYAPFHYGRWAHVRNRWCWVPGPRHVRAVYAPALVGWVGSPGLNVSISVGGGRGVGWFPLGPREVYVPARRYSSRYVERVNVSNTVIVNRTSITNVYDNRGPSQTYRNRTVPGAVTAVSRTTFTSAQRVGGRRIRVDERENARTTAIAPHIEPVRESRLGVGEARRNVRMPPQTVVNRQVIVKRDPPPSAARFARNRRPDESARAPVDRSPRPQDHVDRGEAAIRSVPNNPVDANARADANRDAARTAERDRVRAERNARNVQNAHDDRPPQARQGTNRSPRTIQPQADEVVRQSTQSDRQPSADRQQSDRPRADRTQPREQQAELQQRNQREQQEQHVQRQQQERERATQGQRELQQRRTATEQAEQRQRVERPQPERPQPERQNRPEPQKPVENKQQPQRQQDQRDRRQQDVQKD